MLRAHAPATPVGENAIDDRHSPHRIGRAAGHRLAGRFSSASQGIGHAAIAALAAHLLHDFGVGPSSGAAFVQHKRDLAQARICRSGRHSRGRARVSSSPLASRRSVIFGDQRGAVARLVGPIFRVEGLHGAGFVLGRLVFADQAGERLPDFGLTPARFSHIQALQCFLSSRVAPRGALRDRRAARSRTSIAGLARVT